MFIFVRAGGTPELVLDPELGYWGSGVCFREGFVSDEVLTDPRQTSTAQRWDIWANERLRSDVTGIGYEASAETGRKIAHARFTFTDVCELIAESHSAHKIEEFSVSFRWYGENVNCGTLIVHLMARALIGYARCSTDKQDLAAQRAALIELGVAANRIYVDLGLTGTHRARPGLDQALAVVRRGDTLVVPKLDRLARSVPDARYIAEALVERGLALALGHSRYNPMDPMGKMLFISWRRSLNSRPI